MIAPVSAALNSNGTERVPGALLDSPFTARAAESIDLANRRNRAFERAQVREALTVHLAPKLRAVPPVPLRPMVPCCLEAAAIAAALDHAEMRQRTRADARAVLSAIYAARFTAAGQRRIGDELDGGVSPWLSPSMEDSNASSLTGGFR